MVSGRSRSLVALIVLAGLVGSLRGRLYVECADGTPCSTLIARAQATAPACCLPRACDQHPAPPSDKTCVLKLAPAGDSVPPGSASTPVPLAPDLHLPYVVAAVPEPAPGGEVEIAPLIRPSCPSPGQAHAPRAPPWSA